MDHFGLDIGSQGLRLIELAKETKGYRLLVIASSNARGRLIFSEAEQDQRELTDAIKKLVEKSKVDTRQVVISLPESAVFSRLIKVPSLTTEELSSAITWEAEQYIPVPLKEVNLDWEIISRPGKEQKDKRMEVFLVAAPTKLIEKYSKIVKLADLVPVAIETESIAIARSLVADVNSSVLLIDFGAAATDIVAVRQGKIVLTRSISTGGGAFTRALSGALKMEEKEAEEYKKTYGLKRELEGKIKKVLLPLLETVVGEIKKSIDFYNSAQRDVPLNLVILSGGTAKMPEVANFLTDKLGLEVQLADPFARFAKDQLISKFLSDAPLFSVAVGLAMKET